MADLQAAMQLSPQHISWYQLTLEPNTVFHARPPANMPDDDHAFEIQECGVALLRQHGFEQYEVSAYAHDNLRSRHNGNYWLFGDYLAVGAGAHGKMTTATSVYRYQKLANPMQYMMAQEAAEPTHTPVALGRDDLIFDFMLNALRLNAGFSEETFVERTGLQVSDLDRATEDARQKGLLQRDDNATWRPTELGTRFLNDLQAEFIVESS